MNKLSEERSLYLKQHANNPVDWYPWCEEAFEKAKKEDKPVLVSIGYSSCHWCHVMAHETFEDGETAKALNKDFICIKVDREQRPDIDRKFMVFVQATSGKGGWPLNVFLTPDQEPFFGGTYFPPTDRGQMPGFNRVLTLVLKTYREKNKDLGRTYKVLSSRLDKLIEYSEDAPLDPEILKKGYSSFKEGFDYVNGGSIGSPKFPQHSFIHYLFRISRRFRDQEAFSHAELTLNKMSRGGIYDHVGGGLHRYSVDAYWRVPHFEKMLYDQGQYLQSMCELYRATGEDWIEDILHSTSDFVMAEMYSDKRFASSLDADSKDGEGSYYVWTEEELQKIFDPMDLKFIAFYFDISIKGNFEDGKNVISTPFDDDVMMEKMGFNEEELTKKRKDSLEKLFDIRTKRDPPQLDRASITSWNGLMCSALLKVWDIFHEKIYLDHTKQLLNEFCSYGENGKVPRIMGTEEPGFFEDHIFAAQALFDGFAYLSDKKYLDHCISLVEMIKSKFFDSEKKRMSLTEISKEFQMDDCLDHEVPSPTSQFILLLTKLHDITLDSEYETLARDLLISSQKNWKNPGPGAANLLCALDAFLGPRKVAVITKGDGLKDNLTAMKQIFDPNILVLLKKDETDIPVFKDRVILDGKSTVYLCQEGTCKTPVTDPGELAQLME